ncbi:MAG: hypothetical protein Q8R34_02160 [bacterium]|nr:hypothetical protein [bacterium]
MRKFDIPKETLKNLYIGQGLTTYQIADKFDSCQATIWKRLHAYGIKPRWPWNAVKFSKKELYDLYIKKKLSTWEIEKRYGYIRGTVYRKLKEFKIPVRNIAISHITNERHDFSGDKIEQAHLIGFRVGDLNISKRGLKSETIVVKCASTQKEQINLFKTLFSGYGHILEGKPTKFKKVNIQTSLNLSFSFLLPKSPKSYQWVFEKQNTFFAFLAGFSDAEGSFMVTNKWLAVFALGNYDVGLLLKIKKFLGKYRIETPKLTVYYGKGVLAKNGYISNGDYYTLRCSRKKYLLKLINYLDPYLKHPDKVAKIKELVQNINQRNKKYNNLRMD